MSSLIFVRDAVGQPLMPMAPAHARKLLAQGKARRQPHHAFTIVQLLTQPARPSISPIVLGIQQEVLQSRFWVMSYSNSSYLPLLYLQAGSLARRPFSHFGQQMGGALSAAIQTMSLRITSAVASIIASLVPISSVHIFALQSEPYLRRRLVKALRCISNVPVIWSQQLWAKTEAPELYQLQSFMAQPSIALSSCVVLPTKSFLDQQRVLWAAGPQAQDREYSVALSGSRLYLIDSQQSEGFFPYWVDHRRVFWSRRNLREASIHRVSINDPCFFVPIRAQSDRLPIGEDSGNGE